MRRAARIRTEPLHACCFASLGAPTRRETKGSTVISVEPRSEEYEERQPGRERGVRGLGAAMLSAARLKPSA